MDSTSSLPTRGRALDLGPAAAVLGVGVLTIALSNSGRHGAHRYWLAAVLVESVVAVAYRRRHPFAALAAVLAAYLVFDYLALAVLPLFFVLAAVAASARERATFVAGAVATAVVFLVPALHHDPFDAVRVLLPLGVIALAVTAGSLWERR